jgi:succinate dehydrogenase / fumarate reductase cytochrome b subunit
MTTNTKRPIHLDLRRIRFPMNALTSIGHRISGVLMFLATPLCIYLLDISLTGTEGFAEAKAMVNSGLGQLVLFLLLWALLHHLFAGIRCIAIDLDWGITKPVFLQTALVAMAAAPIAALVLWGLL